MLSPSLDCALVRILIDAASTRRSIGAGFDELTACGCGLEELEAKAGQDDGVFGDHLRRILVMLGQDGEPCAAVCKLLTGESGMDFETFYRLRSAGVLCGESGKEAKLRCEIYGTYLRRHLL